MTLSIRRNWADKFVLSIILILCCHIFLGAQIRGCVYDGARKPLEGVVMTVNQEISPDSLVMIGYDISDSKGLFSIAISPSYASGSYKLVLAARLLGFKSKKIDVRPNQTLDVFLDEDAVLLKEVSITAKPVSRSSDTTSYVVDLLKRKNDKTIEQLLSRLPGITIGDGGKIFVEGLPITKLYIEGLDMLGVDYNLVTRNLHPNDVASVQVLSNHQPIKLLKNVVPAEASAINLKLKEKKKLRPVGKGYIGVGYDSGLLYDVNLFLLSVHSKKQFLTTLESNSVGRLNTMTDVGSRFDPKMAISPFLPSVLLDRNFLSLPSIPLSHYKQNYSASGTFNSIYKITEDSQISPRIRYTFDKDRHQTIRRIMTSDIDQSSIKIIEQNTPYSRSHRLRANAEYEMNRDRVYVVDKILGDIEFHNMDIKIDGSNFIHQKNVLKEYRLLNEFKYIHRGHLIQNLGMTLSWHVAPTNQMILQDQNFGRIIQTAGGNQLNGGLTYGVSKQILDHIDFAIDLGMSGEHNRLTTVNPDLGKPNLLNSHGFSFFAHPEFRFQNQKWYISTLFPFILQYFNYKNIEDGKERSIKLLTPEYKVFMRYIPNAYWSLVLQNYHRHNFGNAMDYLLQPIQTNYRDIVTMGVGEFGHNQSNTSSITVKYSDPIDGVNFTSLSSYTKRWYNLSSNKDVDHYTSKTLVLKNKHEGHQFVESFHLSKMFYEIGTSVNINAEYNFFCNRIHRNQVAINVKNHIRSLKGSVSSHLFKDILFADINLRFVKSTQFQMIDKIFSVGTNYKQWVLNTDMRVYLTKGFSLYGDYSVQWLNSPVSADYKSYKYLNIGAEYQGKVGEIELTISNLLNQKEYTETSYSGLDYHEVSTILRPRQLFLKYTYRF